MTSLPLTIRHELPVDSAAIERLHERAFGPGRFARTAFRLREGVPPDPALSFATHVGTFLVGSVKVGKWQLGARFRIVTGNPYTQEVDDDVTGVDPDVIAPLGHRLPTFVQLDLRADRLWKRPWGTMKFFLDLQNATWRDNVEDVTFDDGEREEIPDLPIFPSIGLEYIPPR